MIREVYEVVEKIRYLAEILLMVRDKSDESKCLQELDELKKRLDVLEGQAERL